MRSALMSTCLHKLLMWLKGALRISSVALPCLLVAWTHGCDTSNKPSSNSVTQPTLSQDDIEAMLVEKDDEIHRLFLTLRDNPYTLHPHSTPSMVRLAEQEPHLFLRKELWRYVESHSDRDEFLVLGVIDGVLGWYEEERRDSLEVKDARSVVSQLRDVGTGKLGVYFSAEDVLALKRALIRVAQKFAEEEKARGKSVGVTEAG